MQLVNDNIIFGLDIGTRSIVGIVGYQESDGFHILAHHVELHQTRSMIDGQIHDIEQVALTIKTVKSSLEKTLNRKLRKVCIAAAGRVLKTIQTHIDIDIEDHNDISKELILSLELQGMERALHQVNYQHDEENTSFHCVGYSVTQYYLNGFVMKNLLGHKGSVIGADVLSTFLPTEIVDSLYKVIALADLEVYSLTLEPIAAIEVAIPQSYRLLNIALVDIGAGTSDIAITRAGSIVAYGMIPFAGDEITESIVHEYLVDFNTAEKIKIASSGKSKSISFKDAMGIKQTVDLESVRYTISQSMNTLAFNIASKIKELNGGLTTNAVFIVGGGGQLSGFESLLAEKLGLSEQRVAIRGKDVLTSITSEDQLFKKKPEFVTPIGICLTGLHNNQHDFIEIFLNDETLRIFNTQRLTVMDVVALKGIEPKSFIPRRGQKLTFYLNGQLQTIHGEIGEPAKIYVNQKEADLSHPILMHDYITILPAKDGKQPKRLIKDLLGETFVVLNNEKKIIQLNVTVNKEIKSLHTDIHDGDSIEYIYPSIREVLTTFEVDYTDVFVNEKEASIDDSIKSGDTIHTFIIDSHHMEQQSIPKRAEQIPVLNQLDDTKLSECKIIVNHQEVILSGKKAYIFVDIFDFYPFDRTKAVGSLVTTKNGQAISYMEAISSGDNIEIYWK